MKPETRGKLETGTEILVQEFAALPRAEVVERVDAWTAVLLKAARFDDYIPILVHRFARQQLRERLDLGTLAEAA